MQDGPLKEAITAAFGSLDNLKKEFNTATLGIQGSGWGWLVSFNAVILSRFQCLTIHVIQGYNTSTKRLEIATTPNQDPLLHLVPIIGVDIWEHAFYLQYLNVKADVRPT